jgi:hypothetical protein
MIYKKKGIFWSLILFFFLVLSWFCLFSRTKIIEPRSNNSLEKNGYQILSNIFQENEISDFIQTSQQKEFQELQNKIQHHSTFLRRLKECIPLRDQAEKYQFQDYLWIIQKSVVHICHRDNNGDFFNEGQRFPSYTILLYLEDMEPALGVFPGSHCDRYTNAVNLSTPLTPVSCKKGDVIIFNANIVHTGMINDYKEDHLRIQMKFTHCDDILKIAYYENFHKILNTEASLPTWLRKVHQSASCTFPIISDWTQGENIRTARGTDNGVDVGWIQRAFSSVFYGNADFYDLPNVF